MPDVHSASDKADVMERVAALAAAMPDPPEYCLPLGDDFITSFYSGVPPQDLVTRTPECLLAVVASVWQFLQRRKVGAAQVRVLDAHDPSYAWSAGRTIVDVINDDMPFLVDSVRAALNALDGSIEMIVHPVMQVIRDADGRLLTLVADQDRDFDRAPSAESLIHIELSGMINAADAALIQRTIERVLLDVRAVVVDWAPMIKLAQAVADSLSDPKLPVAATEASEVAALLSWMIDDHFTFLGYREYAIGVTGMSVVPETGRGVLRDDSYRLFDGVRDVTQFPPDLQQFLESSEILMISKSNRRSTVHRPVQLDTVGIKVFDEAGKVVGQRVIVGLFTSASYNEPTQTIPVLRRKVHRTIARARVLPDGHDGKALRHILDTYPRDELFQISEIDLFATAMGILHLQDRSRVALFVRRDEVEAQWEWIDAIRETWADHGIRPKSYTAGSWGPSAAIALAERDGAPHHANSGRCVPGDTGDPLDPTRRSGARPSALHRQQQEWDTPAYRCGCRRGGDRGGNKNLDRRARGNRGSPCDRRRRWRVGPALSLRLSCRVYRAHRWPDGLAGYPGD